MDDVAIMPAGVCQRLLSGDARCGWQYRDPEALRRSWTPPPPQRQGSMSVPTWQAGLRAVARYRRVWLIPVILTVLAVLALGSTVAAAGTASYNGTVGVDQAQATVVLVWLLCLLPLLWFMAVRPWLLYRRADRFYRVAAGDRAAYAAALDEWARARDAFLSAEQARVDALEEWLPVAPDSRTRRLDVYGGTHFGWTSLVTTYGASLLGHAPPLLVVDLSEGGVARELGGVAVTSGMTVSVESLPDGLDRSDLLSGLAPNMLTDILVEVLHGEAAQDTRAERLVDHRILSSVVEVLQPGLSIVRLREALQVLLGQPVTPRHLTPAEADRIATELYSSELLGGQRDRILRLESQLVPLEALGAADRPTAPAARLRIVELTAAGSRVAADLLHDLLMQWLIRVVRGGMPEAAPRTVIVAGADQLRGRHLDRLTELSDRQGLNLVLMSRHLRDDTADLLGGGQAALIMRLGNFEEADRAARFIGRGYRFVLSQLGRSLTESRTEGHGTHESRTDGSGTSVSTSYSHSHGDGSWSTSRGRSTHSGHTFGTSRNWSAGEAVGTSDTAQRVYELYVEPTQIQALAETNFILVEHRPGLAPRRAAGDCNPVITQLPRVGLRVADPGGVVQPAGSAGGPH
jgi:hypothetical protein